MIPMTLTEIAAATGGRVAPHHADVVVSAAAVVDSRAAEVGGLFVAVRGERVDGHDFAGDAEAHGAAAALTTRPVAELPCIVVADVVDALGRLACRMLGRLRQDGAPLVIGVTGSSGKTSTKDLLAQVLQQHGETVAPPGSFNNEIGLPLTVLRAVPTTRYLVLEMSARGIGHIAALCAVAPVDIGVVLNVGTAHVGEFGTREAIGRAKSELVRGVVEGGVTVLNADDDIVSAMDVHARGRVVTFGRSTSAQVRATEVTVDDTGRPSFDLVRDDEVARATLRLVGEHHVSNALAAAAVAMECGMPLDAVVDSLSAAVPLSRWRMEVRETAGGVTVVNDAYNANPESMRAALDALIRLRRRGQTWAVLGPMAELGAAAAEEHRAIGRVCAQLGVNHVVTVGADAAPIAEAALAGGVDVARCGDATEAIDLLRSRVAEGDAVLVKASRAAALERVAEALAPSAGAAA